jgi:hypothetical protein
MGEEGSHPLHLDVEPRLLTYHLLQQFLLEAEWRINTFELTLEEKTESFTPNRIACKDLMTLAIYLDTQLIRNTCSVWLTSAFKK